MQHGLTYNYARGTGSTSGVQLHVAWVERNSAGYTERNVVVLPHHAARRGTVPAARRLAPFAVVSGLDFRMTKTVANGSVRHHLRDATAALHRDTECGFAGLNLAARRDYRVFLAANAAAVMPLEVWADTAGAADLLPDWPARRRAAALAADLADLGTGVPAPVPPDLGPASVPRLFGMLYVLEGSRLGSRVILDTISQSDARVAAASRFLRHGEGLRLWPTFVASLEAFVTGGEDLRIAIAAARAAFRCFADAQRAVAP